MQDLDSANLFMVGQLIFEFVSCPISTKESLKRLVKEQVGTVGPLFQQRKHFDFKSEVKILNFLPVKVFVMSLTLAKSCIISLLFFIKALTIFL